MRAVLRRPDFRRLYGTRLTSQCADGVFQASLAGVVLFSPESAADPAEIAGGFAALLLPYSFVGPFAGVLLDRWRRQRVLMVANIVRCLLVGLVAIEIATSATGILLYAPRCWSPRLTGSSWPRSRRPSRTWSSPSGWSPATRCPPPAAR